MATTSATRPRTNPARLAADAVSMLDDVDCLLTAAVRLDPEPGVQRALDAIAVARLALTGPPNLVPSGQARCAVPRRALPAGCRRTPPARRRSAGRRSIRP